jgi:hypothetical protein
MTISAKSEWSENDLAKWLVTALEGHVPSKRIQLKLVSKFGLADDEALVAVESACAGILLAISGSKKNMPNPKTNPIGHAAFTLVWDTFNQNSFFDKRHSPNRKWLDWREQQTYQESD